VSESFQHGMGSLSANARAFSIARASIGFWRKQTAPFDMARERCDSLEDAVTNITGVELPLCRSMLCMSIPLTWGISTSVTIHALSRNASEQRKLLADEKVSAIAPSERTSDASDSRTDSSSSTMDTRIFLKERPPFQGTVSKSIRGRSKND
jgi:hypothetical protein